ncbi:S-4TM family putative pore-forming effector [Fibrobacter sp. UWH9]|uniref:S-4TM family putative pore-forming effector n=1 Tax=Fibrobacter sp. UWH9 TaxID=1896213 RepID=UPI000933BE3A
MASIYEKQSDALIIQCLFAQRRNYTYAKLCAGAYFVICVLFVVTFSILKTLYRCDFITGLSIGLSVATIFAASFTNECCTDFKKKASGIQQYMDSVLFTCKEIPCTKWLTPFNKHKIIEIVSSFKTSGFDENDKWYEDYSSKDYPLQILLSQKENIRWDKTLRNYFRLSCNSLLVLAVILIFATALLINPTFSSIIGIVPWSLPFIKYLRTFNQRMKNDCARLCQLNALADSLVEFYHANQINYDDIVNLQNQIYEHRKTAILIPNFFFKLFHNRFQNNEKYIANNLRKE